MKKFTLYIGMLLIMVFMTNPASAQQISLKTNALLWVNCTPNLSAEFVTSKRTSFDATAFYTIKNGPFDFNVRGASLEYRYWLAGRPFVRSFVGLSIGGTNYRILSDSTIKQGDAGGVGLTFGYVLPIGKHWNIEFVSGFGAVFFREKRYNKYEFENNMDYNENGHRYLPNKIGVSIGYTF